LATVGERGREDHIHRTSPSRTFTLTLTLTLTPCYPLPPAGDDALLFLYTRPALDSVLPAAAAMPQDLKKLAPQAQASRKGPYTVEAAGAPQVAGETIPRRNLVSKDALKLTPSPDVTTMYDILRHASTKFGNAKAVGARRIVNKIHETKKIKKMIDGKEQEVDKKWEYYELSGYTYKSFVEFEKMALAVGSAVQKLGFQPHDRLHLFAATSMQWLASAHGKLSHPPHGAELG
jgi:hypothetical protein